MTLPSGTDGGVHSISDPDSPSNAIFSRCDIQGGYAGTGNINTDPLFVNAAAGDYHLQTTSPCLGAGTPNGAPVTTLDGYTRPTPPSIGAFEGVPTTISGQVALQWWTGAMPPLTFTLTPAGTTGGGVMTQTVTPAGDGSFTLSGISAGTYTLGIQGSQWLKKNVSVDTTGGSVSGLSVSLPGGDASGDNQVNGTDYLILRKAYGTAVGDANYDGRADFTGDGQVNGTDYLLLRKNYGTNGD